MKKITEYRLIRQDISPVVVYTDPSDAVWYQQVLEYKVGVPCWILRW
jgi:hypothetical protein